ncbi:B-cadherin-like [Salminus brasiliensis]|uniref:B-cadherin-like n=1 Tax=Salminus brasiliensis TaxID=930266 RepID=UPI003B83952F
MNFGLLLVFFQMLATVRDVSSYQVYKGTEADEESHHADLEFQGSSAGLKRRKREWVIPPMSFLENGRGPFPKELVRIHSSRAKETRMVFSVTGEGADQPPVGLFTINRNNGWLFVTKSVDREAKDKYVLQVHAVAADGEVREAPMEVIINVIDQNDNKPIFTQNPFLGSVPEAAVPNLEFMTVTATDADDPNTANADIRYSIISQNPQQPNPSLFDINPVTGGIRVKSGGLDRENYPEYTLLIQAADLEGNGLVTTGTAVITVTDSNDNAPQFEKTSYSVSVPENKVGAVVVKLPVTDGDEPQSPAWSAKFRIVGGNNGGFFNISTGPNKQEGIITTVKPLDFELNNKYTLLVAAENDVPFASPLPTSTTTVIVNVQDVNKAPVFDPVEKIIYKPEDLAVETELTVYTATDPDTAKTQTVTYRVGADPAGWLSVDRETGLIRVRSPMDRESPFMKDGKYKALILAVDDDPVPATGTGTLVIVLEDVNDNAPVIEEREIRVCNKESTPVLLSVTDKDGPGFADPYTVELQGDSRRDWTARMNETKTGIILTLKTALKQGQYSAVLRVYDASKLFQDNVIQATVCDCTGEYENCPFIITQHMNNFCFKV